MILQIIQQENKQVSRMSDEEEYYKTLPFTISQDQANPDYVIFGTGLQECLIAAHNSKIRSQTGLVIDTDKTYGSCLKTLTFKELHRLNIGKGREKLYTFFQLTKHHQANVKFFQELMEKKAWRGYNIDIEPNYFFAASPTCDLLREADMDKYMDFRLVQNMLHFDGTGFKNVPLSKGKIFQSKDLGLLQKKLLLNTFHSLTQIYNKYREVVQDHNSTKEFDKQFGNVDQKLYDEFTKVLQEPFMGFLSKLAKGNKKIIDYIAYIICNYQYSLNLKEGEKLPEYLDKDYTVDSFICRFGKFLKSCGIYGEGPYLYVDNGTGDVPQSYSRIASIFGCTYILHPKISIDDIQVEESAESTVVKITTNLFPEGKITTKKIYYGPTFYQMKFGSEKEQDFNTQKSLRILLLCQKIGGEEECPSLVYLLNDTSFTNPVYLFMFDRSSHSCPDNNILYQFETVLTEKEQALIQKYKEGDESWVDEKIEALIGILSKARGDNFKQSIRYVSCYIREKRYPKGSSIIGIDQSKPEVVLRDHSGIDLDSHFVNFKEVVGNNLQDYFKKDEKKEEQEEWVADQETMNLLQRLENLDIHGEKAASNEEQIEVQQQGEQKQQVTTQKQQQQMPQSTTSQNKPPAEIEEQGQAKKQQTELNPVRTSTQNQAAKQAEVTKKEQLQQSPRQNFSKDGEIKEE